jgi:hypothetical protein
LYEYGERRAALFASAPVIGSRKRRRGWDATQGRRLANTVALDVIPEEQQQQQQGEGEGDGGDDALVAEAGEMGARTVVFGRASGGAVRVGYEHALVLCCHLLKKKKIYCRYKYDPTTLRAALFAKPPSTTGPAARKRRRLNPERADADEVRVPSPPPGAKGVVVDSDAACYVIVPAEEGRRVSVYLVPPGEDAGVPEVGGRGACVGGPDVVGGGEGGVSADVVDSATGEGKTEEEEALSSSSSLPGETAVSVAPDGAETTRDASVGGKSEEAAAAAAAARVSDKWQVVRRDLGEGELVFAEDGVGTLDGGWTVAVKRWRWCLMG